MRINILIFSFCILSACVEPKMINGYNGGFGNTNINSSSMPNITINCGESEASQCGNGDPLDVITPAPAASSHVYVLWNSGTTCGEYGTTEYATGRSTTVTYSVGGLYVQLAGALFDYTPDVSSIPFGNYAMWIGIDTNEDGTLDVGEPVNCTDMSITMELGALERTSGWRSAVSGDVTIFNDAGY